MKTNARLVIVGAGIVGCAAAYHLTKFGWKDIIVVDQGPLYETGGSTSHAPGITFGTNPSRLMQAMVKYTTGLLNGMTFEGEQVWYPVGTLEVARTEARMKELWRRYGHSQAYDAKSHMISPEEAQALAPLLDPSAIMGALYRPDDGNAKAWKAAGALAVEAIKTAGADFYGNTSVTDIEVKNGRVQAVITDKGRIECEQVLLCTNIWGSVLADRIGVTLPMMACAHHYAITEPLPEYAGEMEWIQEPPVRHQERSMYFRQWDNAYCTGSYRHEPRLVSPYSVGKDAYWEWHDDEFAGAIDDAIELFPALKGREYVKKVNGMFVFSVDGYPLMGPTHVGGCWTAIGIWVTHAGGAGKAIAEWMAYGHTEWDMREANVNRFHPHQKTDSYITTRASQNYREVYDIIHPKMQMLEPRNVRLAPYHSRLVEQSPHFFTVSGWEVAQWYEENARLLEKYDDQVPGRDNWSSIEWSRIQGAEHLAVRETGGLFNLANFVKFEVSGLGATDYLNYVVANDIDKPVGKVVYTALLDESGGIKADLTVTRVAEQTYWMLTGVGSGPQDLAWLKQHLPADGSVTVRDISSQYTTIGLWGPNARCVLEKVTKNDVSNEAFPYFTAQNIEIGVVPVFALRLSYAGELGWELYCPTEQGLLLWDMLWEAGKEFGVVPAGAGAFSSLRVEKGYRAWGSDIHTEYTPYEAGLGWAVRLKKGDFIGRSALLKARKEGLKRKLVCLTTDDPNAMSLGTEPIYSLDGQKLGYVTSADYGYSVGKLIMYGYLPIEHTKAGTEVEVLYFDQKFKAVVSSDPQFDKDMSRLKS